MYKVFAYPVTIKNIRIFYLDTQRNYGLIDQLDEIVAKGLYTRYWFGTIRPLIR